MRLCSYASSPCSSPCSPPDCNHTQKSPILKTGHPSAYLADRVSLPDLPSHRFDDAYPEHLMCHAVHHNNLWAYIQQRHTANVKGKEVSVFIDLYVVRVLLLYMLQLTLTAI